jgi:hypothetical protein
VVVAVVNGEFTLKGAEINDIYNFGMKKPRRC